MIIVFEGPDKAGKSSLIQAFRNTDLDLCGRRWSVVNFSYPKLYRVYDGIPGELAKLEAYASYVQAFEIFKALPVTANIICDRFWPGELAYAFVRGYTYDLKERAKFIGYCSARMNELAIPLVYVRADFNTIEQRFAASGDPYVSLQDLKGVWENYERLFKEPYTMVDVDRMHTIDTSNTTLKQEICELRGFLPGI